MGPEGVPVTVGMEPVGSCASELASAGGMRDRITPIAAIREIRTDIPILRFIIIPLFTERVYGVFGSLFVRTQPLI
jgi:hypothetical protein